MDDTEYGAELVYNMLEYHEYIDQRKKKLREDVWLKILDTVILKPVCKNLHVVVDFIDETKQTDYDKFTYRVRFDISIAKERHIEFVSYEALPTQTVLRSAMDELKYRIHSKWHKFWNTERVKRG